MPFIVLLITSRIWPVLYSPDAFIMAPSHDHGKVRLGYFAGLSLKILKVRSFPNSHFQQHCQFFPQDTSVQRRPEVFQKPNSSDIASFSPWILQFSEGRSQFAAGKCAGKEEDDVRGVHP